MELAAVLKQRFIPFTDERRIQIEGQRDGERNLPDMGTYSAAPFEQALIANGERRTQRIYQRASAKISRLQPLYQMIQKRYRDMAGRQKAVAERFETRKQELGRDVAMPFPSRFHWALIIFLGIGEFPLNTVVFRLFGEPEFLTYVMASTLAITIPLLGLFIGLHMRQSIPKTAGNILVGLLTPISVGAALFGISVLRGVYISTQAGGANALQANQNEMQYILFSLNILVFFAALVSSFYAHDPDEKLDVIHSSLVFLDRKRNRVRGKLFTLGMKLNGEIQQAKSQIEQIRALTNQRVALYRQTNIRFRQLLPPPSFRRDPDYPELKWWPEVSLDELQGDEA
ncbi:MAG TPA: hypothetical protein VML36_04965 [Nitrospiria bacterium]|nr:hypothetical protein [Nitrospiria bacterium]